MISIAMTTYNGEKYLKYQLESILSQTYKDFEVIICDDCSSDNTFLILEEYVNKDPRIKIYKNDENLGFVKNFEKAIKLCSGEFIALSDQDDLWTQNHLEVLYNNIGNHYLICANAELVDTEGNSMNDYVRAPDFYVASDINEQLVQQVTRNAVQGCTCLFRSELVKYYFPNPANMIAHDFWLGNIACMLPEHNGIEGMTYIPVSVLKYRQHQNNTVGAEKSSLKRLINHFTRSSYEGYMNNWKFLENLDFSFMAESRKELMSEIITWVKNMAYRSTRIKGIPFFMKYKKILFFTGKSNLYVFMWFVKLFVFFN